MPDRTHDKPKGRWGASLVAPLNALAEKAWFAYLTIILLQLKVLFGLWTYRDLTVGDTAHYFQNSLQWTEGLRVNILWSPLYTAFLGTLHALFDNAFWTLVVARLFIAVLVTVLVLAVLRRLLPKPLAWCMAAWWAILPITFDTVYSVHLFSALFPLAVLVAVAYVPNVYGRGLALGLFIVTTVLVRNEYLLATLLWAALVLGYEWFQHRKRRGAPRQRLVRAYGLPILVASLLIVFFYSRSVVQFPALSEHARPKHTLNVCQIYAFNRIQQGDPWQKSPWTDCREIMERDFGVAEPTFSQAFRRNPGAILGHLWWNITLIPSGTQLALFNRYTGRANPDYLPAERSTYAWLPFILLVLVIGFGLYRVWRERSYWWEDRLRDAAFVWGALLCSVVVVMVVMVMQRPRPSYMFMYTFFLMALAGFSGFVLLRKTSLVRKGAWLMPPGVVLVLILASAHYTPQYVNPHGYKGQGLRHAYERILPFTRRAAGDESTVIMAQRSALLCRYLGYNPCRGLNYAPTMNGKPDTVGYAPYLNQLGVDWLYLDARFLKQRATQAMRDSVLAAGWSLVGAGTDAEGPWVLIASPAHGSSE